MSTKQRIEPDIPDHEVLRKIGGGAYGEVWMARGITGAYRAVKVVRREDFDDERGFEREFEGILKFEPLSRDHPGLVNILHVGRSKDSVSFYYYVMELGDDIRAGREIKPVEYEPRTLRTDIKMANGTAQEAAPCIETGIRLADALEHLHELGLAHRDVKPANIIFVNGKAKLADIGLVADRGQRTFVGTEGFVPPEGPGSAQADVYSLGKVLYEIATGKDRLQFPEVPDELHPDTEPKQWQGLNQVICDICEPKISKRTITSAAQLATALRRISSGKKVKKRGAAFSSLLLWLLLIAFTGYAAYLALPLMIDKPSNPGVRRNVVVDPPLPDPPLPDPPPPIKYCFVDFDVDPPDAFVDDLDDIYDGEAGSVLSGMRLVVGSELRLVLSKSDYHDYEHIYKVPDKESDFPVINMKEKGGRNVERAWYDSIDQMYQPIGEQHVSKWITSATWDVYTEQNLLVVAPEKIEINHSLEDNRVLRLVCVNKSTADEMAAWLTEKAVEKGRLSPDDEIVAIQNTELSSGDITPEMRREGVFPFKMIAKAIPYARMEIETIPQGAEVFLNGIKLVGRTNNLYQKLRPGKNLLELRKDGYKVHRQEIDLVEGALWASPKAIKLDKNDSLIWGRTWNTKSRRKYVSVNDIFMASAYETTVKDYKEYLVAEGFEIRNPQINKDSNEPVVHVKFDEAQAYAKWLTKNDRAKGILGEGYRYRLPTDAEWSIMVGLVEPKEKGIVPLAFLNLDHYPWQQGWKAERKSKLVPVGENPAPVGNFSDENRKKWNKGLMSYFKGYDDKNSGTSEVGLYWPNMRGIHDLAGNVSEWVSDTLDDGKRHVVRGSNFQSFLVRDLRSSYRGYPRMNSESNAIGFRLVIEHIENAEEAARKEFESEDSEEIGDTGING